MFTCNPLQDGLILGQQAPKKRLHFIRAVYFFDDRHRQRYGHRWTRRDVARRILKTGASKLVLKRLSYIKIIKIDR